jgi:hypothetical protein
VLRRAAALLLGVGALLLLTPGAAGLPEEVPGDPTPPVVTPVISGTLGAQGWYVSNVTVNWTVVDPESIILSTSGCDSRTLTADTLGTLLTCTAESDGGQTTIAKTFKLDKTAPVASATPSRNPDANGWYNHALTVTFQGNDPTSGLESCSAAQNYGGPDTPDTSLSGTCRDRAGNTAGPSFALKYDETSPQVSASARSPDANGWYNHALTVTFQGNDPTSGVATCTQVTYAGPDDPSVALAGTCSDQAGNVSGSSVFTLKYDETAPQASATPSRAADVNGWYNHALSVSFAGSDATSGLDACDAVKTYSSPDSASASVAGSCRDLAGNVAPRSFAFKYDQTAPQASATPSRQPNANGWYNAPLTVGFAATDPVSGLDSCPAPASYAGPDSASALLSGTCLDKAGNGALASFALKYDATAPQASATPSRAADVNGWYNHALTVSFAGSDSLSGLDACDAAKTYSSPDSASASVAGSCSDKAGNVSARSFAFKYDQTAPQASATPSRAADVNGWYNHALSVSFAGSDATSGLDSCPAPASYAGPDSASALVSGTCLDKAGNGALASLALKYDATPPTAAASPSRAADANGWYNHPFTVSFQGTDATSGTDTCTAPQSYAGPDTEAASVSGSCRDTAGNQSDPAAFAIKYDATAPQVTEAVPVRAPDQAGWYNRPVAFAFLGNDATAGIESCPAVTYEGADSAAASVAGTCFDRAGNRGSRAFPLKYDATGPQTAAGADRPPDVNGWYNRPLTVSFHGSDAVSGLDSCALPQSYAGPDSASAVVGGACFDKAGNAGLADLPLRYDATAPHVTGAAPARPPDSNGWYNRPLAVTFQGSDVTSEIDGCTVAEYAGPDASAATVSGSCRDRAGNASAPAPFALKYDSTPPSLIELRVRPGNRTASLSWRASPDTAVVEIVRSVASGSRGAKVTVYRGAGQAFTDTRLKNGTLYHYAVTGYDEAHNSATRGAQARPAAPLAPAAGARVSAPPRLSWTPVANATYYNVQVWRNGKILSAWPKRSSIRLKRGWTFAGRRYHLVPGRYRWYVWPGYGRRAARNYGRLIGSSSFVVTR